MLLLVIKIALPWWGWLLAIITLLGIGAFFAWANTQASLKKKLGDEAQRVTDKLTGKN